jgi:hypothetical protein
VKDPRHPKASRRRLWRRRIREGWTPHIPAVQTVGLRIRLFFKRLGFWRFLVPPVKSIDIDPVDLCQGMLGECGAPASRRVTIGKGERLRVYYACDRHARMLRA